MSISFISWLQFLFFWSDKRALISFSLFSVKCQRRGRARTIHRPYKCQLSNVNCQLSTVNVN
ncbi:hypothetical protein [Microcoleus sp. CAWBG556]|uniref:hypothetical protein n=1 Tax=Microcoleus sp. CAWBG556 TaxID=2841650 RepID=UPI0025E0B0CA|nr:hypothetical protein [Microcoleus sp. CAWBG556]